MTKAASAEMNQSLWSFSYLQALDFLTTIAFLVNGVREANPVVKAMMNYTSSPIFGLLAVKIMAIALGVYCWRLGKQRMLSRINIGFALLVAWNLVALIVRSGMGGAA